MSKTISTSSITIGETKIVCKHKWKVIPNTSYSKCNICEKRIRTKPPEKVKPPWGDKLVVDLDEMVKKKGWKKVAEYSHSPYKRCKDNSCEYCNYLRKKGEY